MAIRSIVKELAYRTAKSRRGSNDEPNDLRASLGELRSQGITILRDAVSPAVIERLRDRYHLRPEEFEDSDDSLSFAPADEDILNLMLSDKVFELLRSYYANDPVLQTRPIMVITKPAVRQEDFDLGTHRYPANWHVDYHEEVVVHVPLYDITDETSHTVFACGSHVDFKSVLKGVPVEEGWVRANYKLRPAVAKVGDLIVMDTGGLHRAELNKSSFRCHIHLKFTQGNDLLRLDPAHPKVAKQIEVLKKRFRSAEHVLSKCGAFDLTGLDARKREYLKVLA